MAKKPNDRISGVAPPGDEPDPRVYVVVNGAKFVRPSLETFYARTPGGRPADQKCSCDTVEGTYCKCNKVCTCNLVCSCQSYTSCSCVGYESQSYSGGGSVCSCNQVCSCVPVH
jgi:hypothetical protein